MVGRVAEMVNSAMELKENDEQECGFVHLDLELGLNGKRKRISDKIGPLYPELFKDDCLTVGGLVKARGEVLKQYAIGTSKAPNLTCRIESFGRICQKFDGRRRQWVTEMGFGGLLHLAALGMQLPRQLAYWLLTRVDPVSKIMISPDGKEFSLSPNQVYWVLGIPNGGKPVPTKKNMTFETKDRVEALLREYGSSWETRCSRYEGRVYISKGISVNHMVMERLEGEWTDAEEAEFKTLFLLLSLHMVLCPTQSPRLSADLVPALTCAQDCIDYDWCGLVVSKLLCSVATFARTFYANGYARGSGGCLLFIVVFYLDRLNKVPLCWGLFPRVRVWSMHEVGLVARLDRKSPDGDFGKMGMLDVAYGEDHPREARDSNGPIVIHNEAAEEGPYTHKEPKARRVRDGGIPCFVSTRCNSSRTARCHSSRTARCHSSRTGEEGF